MEKDEARQRGDAMKELRASLGFSTQETFARALGISVSTVQKWEVGARGPSRLTQRLIDQLERKRGKAPAVAVA